MLANSRGYVIPELSQEEEAAHLLRGDHCETCYEYLAAPGVCTAVESPWCNATVRPKHVCGWYQRSYRSKPLPLEDEL